MNDVVSRQLVLDIVSTWTYDMCDYEDVCAALREIKNLPPAQSLVTCSDCEFGIPCGRQIMCELMDYLHFERNDFCSQGVAK